MVGRRDDGYHELDSLVAFADVQDIVRAAPSESLTLAIDGSFAGDLDNDSGNLVLRAASALANEAGLAPGASITLTKNLPVASGIGGGSADAAATLHVLNKLWRTELDSAVLSRLGQSLGADVPVCLFGRTAHLQGAGERIAAGPLLPDCGLLLVNPGVAVSTPAVFSQRQGAFSRPHAMPDRLENVAALVEFLTQCRNDLLEPARRLAPQINDALTEISRSPSCLFASLSGSGATCFALFGDLATARAEAASLRADRPNWWVQAGRFIEQTPAPVVEN